MDNEEIGKFAPSFRGALIGRDHVDYNEVRKLYNGMIDKRPLLIARCADVADVIAAVNFGRDSKLAIAIRGPSSLSYGQLKLMPFWDPLRGDPRFEQIVASLAPNETK